MFKLFFNGLVVRGLLVLLSLLVVTACGGGGGAKTGTAAASSTSLSSFAPSSSNSSTVINSSANNSVAISSSSSSSSGSSIVATYLMGGAIQGKPLNLASVVTTLAGAAPGTDGIGSLARFDGPIGAVTDGTNLYIVDYWTSSIRKIVIATGVVTTFAGKSNTTGITDGIGAAARFDHPMNMTTDGTNLYVTDTDNNTIRKIVIATAMVTTLAGSPESTGFNDGVGTQAHFVYMNGLTTDGTNLYVSDYHSIRKIVIATAEVTSLAGSAGEEGSADGTGAAARFHNPGGMAINGTNLYVADSYNHTIRKVDITTRAVTTVAGSAGFAGDADGVNAAARFRNPGDICSDGANLYVVDSRNNTIRKLVLASGAVTTLAGTAGIPGSRNDMGTAASFNSPQGITTDGTNLYVTDSDNHSIRKIVLATKAVTTIAGSRNDIDATGSAATFDYPNRATSDGINLYVTDASSSTIRKIEIATGVVTTLAGTAGEEGNVDATGALARFKLLYGITTDGTNLYVLDSGNSIIRKIVIATGVVTTLAGTAGIEGNTDATGTSASFGAPQGITTDGSNLYVADSNNNTIRKIVIATGVVTTLAGTAGVRGSSDGIGAAAKFQSPQDITTDGINLYVTDYYNQTIRKIVIATGKVTTLAGAAGDSGDNDGTGTAARFHLPEGITCDGTNLYVVDSQSSTVRKIVIATGVVTTLVGTPNAWGSADGTGANASFSYPHGIATDGTNLYIADAQNNTIRKIH